MEPETNILKKRDKATIDEIEAGFKSGPLHDAMWRAPQIERRRALSDEEFDREYRKKLRPVVIEGLMDDWPALGKWSFDYLVSMCGSARVVVDSYNSQKAREVTFGEFVELLKHGGDAIQAPVYLQEWYYQTNCPFLATDLPELPIAQYDFRRNLYGEEISTNHQLWIGQRGATTRVHQDSYFIDVMHAQIVGKKHWCVMASEAELRRDASGALDFAGLIDDRRTQLMQCVLNRGDIVYLPALWWHRIELLTDSVGLGRKCLDEINLRRHLHMRLAELMALALNGDQVKKTHPELYKVVALRNRAWAQRMNIDLTKLRPYSTSRPE